MKTFKFNFVGRQIGAIGTFDNCEHIAIAYDFESATNDLYRHFEHISKLTHKVIDDPYTEDDLTRINNDSNGNPRYVIHFLALLTKEEKDSNDVGDRYNFAVARAKNLFGGRRFHNKQYGGGIVFQSYNVETELRLINGIHSKGGSK
jgi:hypothetical protein